MFFSRPQYDADLRALADESSIIADAVAQSPDPAKFSPGQTAGAWFKRRIKNQRIANRTVRHTLAERCYIYPTIIILSRARRHGAQAGVLNTPRHWLLKFLHIECATSRSRGLDPSAATDELAFGHGYNLYTKIIQNMYEYTPLYPINLHMSLKDIVSS